MNVVSSTARVQCLRANKHGLDGCRLTGCIEETESIRIFANHDSDCIVVEDLKDERPTGEA